MGIWFSPVLSVYLFGKADFINVYICTHKHTMMCIYIHIHIKCYIENLYYMYIMCAHIHICVYAHILGKAAMGRNGETSCKAEVLVFGKKKIKTE